MDELMRLLQELESLGFKIDTAPFSALHPDFVSWVRNSLEAGDCPKGLSSHTEIFTVLTP